MDLSDDDRKAVGVAIQKVEFGWPIGMPYSRKLESKLWEVRTNLTDGKIARVIFTLVDDDMVLLHGFIKKTQKTPTTELETARKRLKDIQDEQ
ncbi:MAG: type II toxin-antitoxin system RelE/ParE family toxin [Leucothrix sp.]